MKAYSPRYRSKAPSPSCKPTPLGKNECSSEDSRVYQSFPETWVKYARAFSTLQGAVSLTESEAQALRPVPRRAQSLNGEGSRSDLERRMTRSQAVVGQKIEFSFNRHTKPYLRNRGVPMYALLGASEAALQRIVCAAKTRVLADVTHRKVRIRFVVSCVVVLWRSGC